MQYSSIIYIILTEISYRVKFSIVIICLIGVGLVTNDSQQQQHKSIQQIFFAIQIVLILLSFATGCVFVFKQGRRVITIHYILILLTLMSGVACEFYYPLFTSQSPQSKVTQPQQCSQSKKLHSDQVTPALRLLSLGQFFKRLQFIRSQSVHKKFELNNIIIQPYQLSLKKADTPLKLIYRVLCRFLVYVQGYCLVQKQKLQNCSKKRDFSKKSQQQRFTKFMAGISQTITESLSHGRILSSERFLPKEMRPQILQQCKICLELYNKNEEISILKDCKHHFHPNCIENHIRHKCLECPVCKVALSPQYIKQDPAGKIRLKTLSKINIY